MCHDWLIDWLIDWTVFKAVLAISQPYNGDISQERLTLTYCFLHDIFFIAYQLSYYAIQGRSAGTIIKNWYNDDGSRSNGDLVNVIIGEFLTVTYGMLDTSGTSLFMVRGVICEQIWNAAGYRTNTSIMTSFCKFCIDSHPVNSKFTIWQKE